MVTNLLSFFNFFIRQQQIPCLPGTQTVCFSFLTQRKFDDKKLAQGEIGARQRLLTCKFSSLLEPVHSRQYTTMKRYLTLYTREIVREKHLVLVFYLYPHPFQKNPFKVVKILPYGRHGDKGPPKSLVCPLCKRTGEFLFIEISFLKQRKPFI